MLRARDDLSHLYRGMRLPPLSEHSKFPGREQRFCANVLGAAVAGVGSATIGVRGMSASEAQKHYKTKPFERKTPNMLSGLPILSFRRRAITKKH